MIARGKIFRLLVLGALWWFTPPATATTTQSPRSHGGPHTNQWMRAMEASVNGAVRVPDSRPELIPAAARIPVGGLVAWAGWVIAGGFLVGFLSVQLKGRRQQRFLLRGTDLSLLRPAGKRRRR